MRLFPCLLCLLAGCEWTSPGSPWEYPVTIVEGRITFGDQPIRRGWVLLQPLRGTIGDHTIAPIREDGTYHTSRAPVGPLQVRIFLPRDLTSEILQVQPYLAARLKLIREPASPLEVTSQVGSALTYNFDLLHAR